MNKYNQSQIEKAYNPDCDVPSVNSPPVTWVEYNLYTALIALTDRVERLERENKKLRQVAKDAATLASGESLE